MSLRFAFETGLSPLFGARIAPMSTTCSIGIQAREENDVILESFHLDFDSIGGGEEETARPVGWNFVEMESNKSENDHGLCVWLQCSSTFQIHPPYLCTNDGDNYKSSDSGDDAIHVLGTFNILPVSFPHHDFIPTSRPPTGTTFILMVLCLRVVYLILSTIVFPSKSKSHQLEDWTLLGTFPELQCDGQYKIIPCSPVPPNHDHSTIAMEPPKLMDWDNQSFSSNADDDDGYSDADETQSIETT